ncbi:MAG: right-handed parallel beta-helix repeat-containing protein [Planctomycetota bacterium]
MIAACTATLFAGHLLTDRAAAEPTIEQAAPAEAVTPGSRITDESVDVVLTVDPDATGANVHTTISSAFAEAKKQLDAGKSVKVSIAAGVYREKPELMLDVAGEAATEPLLVVEGAGAGQTILSGSDVWPADEWRAVEGHPGVFAHDWPHDKGIYAGPWANNFGLQFKGTISRSEFVVVGGQRFKQAILDEYAWVDPDDAAGNVDGAGGMKDKNNQPGKYVFQQVAEEGLGVLSEPGMFAVSDHPDADASVRKQIFIRLPDGVTPADAGPIEIGRPFDGWWPEEGLLRLVNKNNIVLRGMTITHGTGFAPGAALLLQSCQNVLIEDLDVSFNGLAGINISQGPTEPRGVKSRFITMRDVNCSDNGYKGFGGAPFDSLIERCSFNFNNWRGFEGGFPGFDPAGVKIGKVANVTFRECVAIGNTASGFWFDVFCRDMRYERCLAYGNMGTGIHFELSGRNPEDGDDVVINSAAINNGGPGVKLSSTRRSSVIGNLMANNFRTQIEYLNNGDRPPANPEGYEFFKVHDNVFVYQRGLHGVMVHNKPSKTAGRTMDLMSVIDARNNRYFMFEPESFELTAVGRVDFDGYVAKLSEAGATATEVGSTVESIPDYDTEPMDLFRDKDNMVKAWCEEHGIPLPFDAIERWQDRPFSGAYDSAD